jgi:potassium efflux system protein
VFTAFGASSIDFEVRAFASTLDERLPLVHEVNSAIAEALADAGIEIPFPQQDVYVRSLPAAGMPVAAAAARPPGAQPRD